MTKVADTHNLQSSSTKFKITAPKAAALHRCHLCGSNFAHLFAHNRHLLRQHWFEAQKEFSEERLRNKMEGLTEKQTQKLCDLYKKLKDRNSPTPPKRSRRGRAPPEAEGAPPGPRRPRVSQLKEYKLVTVDDMSQAYNDKYANPGGYTIFHFKVPKKNAGPVGSPPLTALKKTYHSGDSKTAHKTEKVPITSSVQLSSWQQKSFESHLSRGLSRHYTPSLMTSPVPGLLTSPVPGLLTSPAHVTSPAAFPRGLHHVGCGKCSRRKHNGKCSENPDCRPGIKPSFSYSKTLPLNFASPLVYNNFNCTDILKKIINSPESIKKPVISVSTDETESAMDVMSIDLTPTLPMSPASSFSDASPCSSKDSGYSGRPVPQDHVTSSDSHVTSSDSHVTSPSLNDMVVFEDTTEILAQIGLEMVYNHYILQP